MSVTVNGRNAELLGPHNTALQWPPVAYTIEANEMYGGGV